jgi:hypothetical protein
MIMDFLRSVRWALVRDYLILALWAVIGLLAIGGCVRDCSGAVAERDFVWGIGINKESSAEMRMLHMAEARLGVAWSRFGFASVVRTAEASRPYLLTTFPPHNMAVGTCAGSGREVAREGIERLLLVAHVSIAAGVVRTAEASRPYLNGGRYE